MMEIEERLHSLSHASLRSADEAAIAHLEIPRTPRAGQAQSRRAIRIAVPIAAVLVAILVLNFAAAYFAPKYQRALADSGVGPVSQRFLAAAGLNYGDVATIGDSATSGGHTLKLEAGYADGLRTVLFVSIDGKGLTGDPKGYGMNPGDYGIDMDAVTLTDQFGRSYGFGTGVTGPNELLYEPLPWPESAVGARLTLHIGALTEMWYRQAEWPTVAGDWTLHATLISSPAHAIALPAPIHAAEADYTFTSITASETEMIVRWTVDTPLNNSLRNPPAPGQMTDPMADPVVQQYFTPRVYSAAGTEVQMEDWGFEWPKTGPAKGEMTVFISGPGRYRIKLGAAVDDRWVVVP